MALDRSKIENFLYHEARLMDEHAYADWLALFTGDARYWVPSNDDDADPSPTWPSSTTTATAWLSASSA